MVLQGHGDCSHANWILRVHTSLVLVVRINKLQVAEGQVEAATTRAQQAGSRRDMACEGAESEAASPGTTWARLLFFFFFFLTKNTSTPLTLYGNIAGHGTGYRVGIVYYPYFVEL
jgi:hypothetical protein